MAFPDTHYVACFPLQEYFVDKDTGLPLSAGQVFFYKDTDRETKKYVYQQVQLPDGTYDFVILNDPIILTSVGTFADDSGNDIIPFLYPFDANGNLELYFIRVYSSTGVLQFTREAWPPNVRAQGTETDIFEGNDNQISNPQFVEISYTPDPNTLNHIYSVSTAGETHEIAPDWTIVTNGTGTVTVQQLAITDITMPTLAPYSMRLSASAGITSFKLRQRITKSPRLMGSGYLSAVMVAKSFLASEIALSMDYVASNGYTVNLISASTSSDGSYTVLQNSSSALIETTNTDSPDTGYVDIVITIPVLADVAITSVQIVSVIDATSSTPFLQISEPRQIDHLFHYYKDPLEYKPIPSYLVGWDFPLNPAQFATGASRGVAATAIGANKSKYVWDQTIVFQSADSGITVSSGTANELLLTASVATKMAIIQYLPSDIARKILNAPICVNVSAKASVATIATVSLWYTTDASLPNIQAPPGGTNLSLVLTLDASGKPSSFNGNWTEVPRLEGDAKFQIGTSSTTNFNDYGFSTWDMQGIAACNTATYFAIVVGTAEIAINETVGFNSVSLQAGNIPTRPAPQTQDEVIRECQRYFEKSYSISTLIATATYTNSLTFPMPIYPPAGDATNAAHSIYVQPFGYNYKAIKKDNSSIITYYSPDTGTINKLHATIYNNAAAVTGNDVNATLWTSTREGDQATQMIPNSGAPLITSGLFVGAGQSGCVEFHYTADDRLGVV